MTPQQLEIFLEDNRRSTAEAIRATVNGKIDGMRDELRAHMERVEPAIKAYEAAQTFNSGVKLIGERTVFWGKVIGSIGVIVLAVQYVLTQVIRYKP